MINLHEGEKLTRKYIGKIKQQGVGDGILYFTNNRLCFESKKHGLVLNLHYDELYNWGRDKKNLYIQWHENNYRKVVKIEIKKKFNGEPLTTFEVALSLYCQYRLHYKLLNEKGSGYYTNEKGEIINHFYDSILLPWDKVDKKVEIRKTCFNNFKSTPGVFGDMFDLSMIAKTIDGKSKYNKDHENHDFIIDKKLNIKKNGFLHTDLKLIISLNKEYEDSFHKKEHSIVWRKPEKSAKEFIKEKIDRKERVIKEWYDNMEERIEKMFGENEYIPTTGHVEKKEIETEDIRGIVIRYTKPMINRDDVRKLYWRTFVVKMKFFEIARKELNMGRMFLSEHYERLQRVMMGYMVKKCSENMDFIDKKEYEMWNPEWKNPPDVKMFEKERRSIELSCVEII